ncbi:MAG: hypothetical protein H6R03_778 [Burkholderiaceae bacterium]|nr:hypothetical protein [Burkholderiaceae bacterium]
MRSMSSAIAEVSLRAKAPICRFSVTVIRVNTPRPSGTITRPRRSSWCAAMPLVEAPQYSIPPAQAWVPVIAFSVVVLPAPLAPISVTSSPSRISRSTPLTAWMPP